MNAKNNTKSLVELPKDMQIKIMSLLNTKNAASVAAVSSELRNIVNKQLSNAKNSAQQQFENQFTQLKSSIPNGLRFNVATQRGSYVDQAQETLINKLKEFAGDYEFSIDSSFCQRKKVLELNTFICQSCRNDEDISSRDIIKDIVKFKEPVPVNKFIEFIEEVSDDNQILALAYLLTHGQLSKKLSKNTQSIGGTKRKTSKKLNGLQKIVMSF